jgi:hypothetical protein
MSKKGKVSLQGMSKKRETKKARPGGQSHVQSDKHPRFQAWQGWGFLMRGRLPIGFARLGNPVASKVPIFGLIEG